MAFSLNLTHCLRLSRVNVAQAGFLFIFCSSGTRDLSVSRVFWLRSTSFTSGTLRNIVATGMMSQSARAQLAASKVLEPPVIKSRGVGKMPPRSQAVMYLLVGPADFCAGGAGFQTSVKVVAIAGPTRLSAVASKGKSSTSSSTSTRLLPSPPYLECKDGKEVDLDPIPPSSTFRMVLFFTDLEEELGWKCCKPLADLTSQCPSLLVFPLRNLSAICQRCVLRSRAPRPIQDRPDLWRSPGSGNAAELRSSSLARFPAAVSAAGQKRHWVSSKGLQCL
mmetsp:Transcript_27891/g.60781  ORF Transcript_27891/g.60781 Transcript_27891/m.60781 type:complete len:278 (+) Transcript_27891:2808-3641(+)